MRIKIIQSTNTETFENSVNEYIKGKRIISIAYSESYGEGCTQMTAMIVVDTTYETDKKEASQQ